VVVHERHRETQATKNKTKLKKRTAAGILDIETAGRL
jgi:hypothetical protein